VRSRRGEFALQYRRVELAECGCLANPNVFLLTISHSLSKCANMDVMQIGCVSCHIV